MKRRFSAIAIALALIAPLSAFAQTTLTTWEAAALWIFVKVFQIGGVAAFALFLWNLGIIIFNSEDPKKAENARGMMMWSVIALFIMITIWGTIAFLQRTTGTFYGPVVPVVYPRIP